MGDWVALLRGINVGQAKRVPMAELRAAYERLGLHGVATLLNSGNVVFSSDVPPDPEALRRAVREATGVDAETIVVEATAFDGVLAKNPCRGTGREAKRVAVAFPAAPIDVASIEVPAVAAPEELVVESDAVYQWLPDGVLASSVPPTFWRSLGTSVTSRNDATLQKIAALLAARRV